MHKCEVQKHAFVAGYTNYELKDKKPFTGVYNK